ncbi:hypothetical protein AOCH_004476 [Aspergillus ochraceoroseus]|uniref:ASST-domain-containing protein n=1 Tax=Aspergillus ochraceoroseus TaxID=138278 RepID=A0A0F8UXK3_9EURO|nr:hypothetical protein AOCH_004476 [Aspergillus ochraceoroseus]
MPEARPIKFNVTYHDRSRVSAGFFFVAPYWNFIVDPPVNRWMPCQMGPHIYDADGHLVWSGACQFGDHNVFDFRMTDNIDDQQHLTFVKAHSFNWDSKGEAYVLNHKYEIENIVGVTNQLPTFDTHEFRVLDGGRSALVTQYRGAQRSFADFSRSSEYSWVIEGGLLELDMDTGEVLYDWNSAQELSLSESYQLHPDAVPDPNPQGHDFLHVNSVDKDSLGNYLLSARYTSTIYYISAAEHRILWRLGGKKSDFTMDFTFSGQHDARFRFTNSTHMILSLFNNGGVDEYHDEDCSSGLIVLLDLQSKHATRLGYLPRPDKGLTPSRGNFQFLPNGNYLLNWVNGGYMTEFSPDGQVSWKPASTRTATPRYMTLVYTSWNGATDIVEWVFYAQHNRSAPAVRIGSASKIGFETVFSTPGYFDWISVEAIDLYGKVLGGRRRSGFHRTRVPAEWEMDHREDRGNGNGNGTHPYPTPDNPETTLFAGEDPGGPVVESELPAEGRSTFLLAMVLFVSCLGMGRFIVSD